MNQQQAFEQRIDEALHNAQLRQNFRSAMDGIRQRRSEQFPDEAQLQALREQVQTLQKEKIEVEKSTAVNQLLSEGKISPNEESVAREAYELRLQGRDSFWNMFSERPSNSVVNMSTIGHGASGQEINKESLHLKVKKLSEDKGISYSQALTEFRSSNPQEYNQAYGV